jgi:hypothetical protein
LLAAVAKAALKQRLAAVDGTAAEVAAAEFY